MRGGWRRRVNEIGASFEATHGPCSAVVSTCSFFSSIESSKPSSFFRLRVSNLGCITAPRPATDATVPHCATGGVVISESSLETSTGGGGGGGGGGCSGGSGGSGSGGVVALNLVVEEGVISIIIIVDG